MFFEKPTEDIQYVDIEALVEQKEPEGDYLDYKETYAFLNPRNPDKNDSRANFAKDVAAFANRDGGYLVLGVSDDGSGLPQAIVSVDSNKVDGELETQLLNVIATGIEPRLVPNVRVVCKSSPDGTKRVVVVRVEPSVRAPHQVTKERNFPIRYGSSTQYMTTRDLSEAYLVNERWAERIKRFREERLTDLEPIRRLAQLSDGIGLVIHLVPSSSFRQKRRVDLHGIRSQVFPMPIGDGKNAPLVSRFNAKGLAAITPGSGVIQFFWDGSVEFACGKNWIANATDKAPRVFLRYIEDIVLLFVNWIPSLCKKCGANFPFSLHASLLNLDGFEAASPEYDERARCHGLTAVTLEQDRLDLFDVVLEEGEEMVLKIRPMFDNLWQSFGYERSPSYSVEGKWNRLPMAAGFGGQFT